MMTKKIIPVLFMAVILLSVTVLTSVDMVQQAEAAKSQGKNTPGRVGTQSYGSKNNSIVCGGMLCSEYPGGYNQYLKDQDKTASPAATQTSSTPKTEAMSDKQKSHPAMHFASDTITSITDPLIGHESHQLATILPFSDKIYTGTVTFAASENVQLVVLHGPLEASDVRSQPTVTTPEGVKYALTFVDLQSSAGSAKFAGNMLALHTLKTDPFDVTYSVFYKELDDNSNTVKTDTITSVIDPLVGHESHSLAMIIPPSEKIQTGTVTYAASESVQLVVLHGPLALDETRGQPTVLTTEGTKYALTFVNPDTSAGTWSFAGNALALHTLKTDPFDVTYSVVSWSSQ